MTRLRIGTRGSALALWQSRHIAARLAVLVPDVTIELVEIVSTGDRVTDLPLSHVEGMGFFTATIEQARSRSLSDPSLAVPPGRSTGMPLPSVSPAGAGWADGSTLARKQRVTYGSCMPSMPRP